MSGTEVLRERYELVMDRIRRIPGERLGDEKLEAFFSFCAEFLLMVDDTAKFLAGGGLERAELKELEDRNRALYADVLPAHYKESYGNPAYAAGELGEELGALLSFLYTELRSLIAFTYEERLEERVIRMELFAEIYTAFVYAADQDQGRPSCREIKDMIYWFASDYTDLTARRRTEERVDSRSFGKRMILESDLTDVRYLYGYGEYIGESELERARLLAGLSRETVAALADAYTESCRMAFEAAGLDLSGEKIVSLGYPVGLERMLRRAVENFERVGIQTAAGRMAHSVLDGAESGGHGKNGFRGGIPNPQFEDDHRDDKAIFFDKNYVNRRLDADRAACENRKEPLGSWAGSVMAKTRGEAAVPAPCREALRLSREQERLCREYASRAGRLRREYVPEDRSGLAVTVFLAPGPVLEEVTAVGEDMDPVCIRKEGGFVPPGVLSHFGK